MDRDHRIEFGDLLELQRRTGLPSTFQQLRVHTDWRTSWTHIVGGQFSAAHDDCVLFYEGGAGFAELYQTDGHGNISLLRQFDDLGGGFSQSHRWTHILVCRLGFDATNSLLLYDQHSGFAAIFNVDSAGNLVRLRDITNFGHWTHLTTVRVPGSTNTALLRYDQSRGRGEIHVIDAFGNLSMRQSSDGWRRTWTHIAGGYGTGNSVLLYEAATGHCEIYNLTYDPANPDSDPNSLGDMASIEMPANASLAIGGSFGLDGGYGLYYPAAGKLQFLFVYDFINNGINTVEQYEGVGANWDIISTGGFFTPDADDFNLRDGRFSSLLFYDRDAGHGAFFLHWPYAMYEHAPLAGYASPGSALPGETVAFSVSSAVGPFSMRIYRVGAQRELLTDLPAQSNGAHPLAIARLAYRDGPGWEPVATLRIPENWPSGLYVAQATAGGDGDPGHDLDIPFVVRAREPGSQSNILVFVNDTTYEAYNFWGRSLYGFRTFDVSNYTSPGAGSGLTPWGFHLSFQRPFIGEVPFVGRKWTYWEEPLANWLGRLGIGVEWATLSDLDANPKLLDGYAMVAGAGHSEYYSRLMYDALRAFVARGGNAAFFSGNNCWWRIRIENDGGTMTCYKDERFDPAADKTVNWTEGESGALLGTTIGAVISPVPPDGTHSRDDAAQVTAHFVTRTPDHWVFFGTDLAQDAPFGTFGDGGTVVGYETDIATSAADGSWTTLAEARFATDATQLDDPPVIASMRILENKGSVFTAATVDWTRGLSQDANTWSAVDQITLNLFKRFAGLGAACDIVGFDANGAVQVDTTNNGWRSSWDVMLAAPFTRTDRDQVVLYDRAGGALAIVGFDDTGAETLDRTDETIGSNWTDLVAGQFIGNVRKQVLLYDKTSGDTLLVGFDGDGQVNLRRADGGWRTSWDLITVGAFIGNRRDQVLLYDRAAGQADVVGYDDAGQVNLDTTNTGWRSSWDWMVAGSFLNSGAGELWLCDRAANFAEILAFDAAGNFRSLLALDLFGSNRGAAVVGDFMQLGAGKQQILRYNEQQGSDADIMTPVDGGHDIVAGDWMDRPWNLLLAGRFTGASRTEYLRYIAADGFAEMWGIDGVMTRINTYPGWRDSWVLAATGRFLGNEREQIALYSRGRF
jgi:hypothetical protein